MRKPTNQTEINPYPTISLKVDPDLKDIYDSLSTEAKIRVRKGMKLVIEFEHDKEQLMKKYADIQHIGLFK